MLGFRTDSRVVTFAVRSLEQTASYQVCSRPLLGTSDEGQRPRLNRSIYLSPHFRTNESHSFHRTRRRTADLTRNARCRDQK